MMDHHVVDQIFRRVRKRQAGNAVDGHQHQANRQQAAPRPHQRPNFEATDPERASLFSCSRRRRPRAPASRHARAPRAKTFRAATPCPRIRPPFSCNIHLRVSTPRYATPRGQSDFTGKSPGKWRRPERIPRKRILIAKILVHTEPRIDTCFVHTVYSKHCRCQVRGAIATKITPKVSRWSEEAKVVSCECIKQTLTSRGLNH